MKTYANKRRRQEGAVLMVAVIILVVMTIAALGLVRSVGTGNQVAGNLAFKRGATAAGDIGIKAALDWLTPKAGDAGLYQDQPAQGYYATSQLQLDITGSSGGNDRALVDWDMNDCAGTQPTACIKPSAQVDAGNGNSVRFVIHRLCSALGDPNAGSNACANYQSRTSASSVRGELSYDKGRITQPPSQYYRITARVKGPKNTVSFVETTVHF